MPATTRGPAATNALYLAAAVALGGGLPLIVAAPVGAQETPAAGQPRRYDLAAGPLAQSLDQLGRMAGVTISFDPDTVAGVAAPPLRGEYRPAEALRVLLAGTELDYRRSGAGFVVAQDNAGATELAPITVEAGPTPVVPALDPVQGYNADFSSTLTRSPIARRETPASIGVVTRDFIRDTGADSRDEALEQVPGVVRNQSRFGQQEVTIRGFELSKDSQELNGLTLRGARPIDPSVLERIEVVRGPAAIVNGAGEPGGTFNVITKRPQPEAFAELEQQAGSYGLLRSVADLNTPLTMDKAIRARLAVSATPDDGSFIDNTESSEITVVPTIEANTFGGDGTLRLTFIHQDFDGVTYRGIGLFEDGGVPNIDPETNIGGGDRNGAFNQFEGNTAQLEYSHDFLERLSLTARVGYNDNELDLADVYAFSYTGIAPNGDVNIYASRRDLDKESLAGELFVTGRVGPRDRSTDVTLGVDYKDQEEQEFFGFAFGGTDNVFNPRNDFAVPGSGFTPFVDRTTDIEQTGLFAQFVTRPLSGLTVTAGARRDIVDLRNEDLLTDTVSGADIDDENTFRLGASYELLPGFNLYASYQESFQVQTATQVDGSVVPPETGESLEGGFKWDFAEDLSLAFAIFQTDRENRAVEDPDNPRFSIAGGEQRHEGIELELNGDITETLRVSAQFSLIDAEFTQGPLDGLEPSGVPVDYVGRIFAVYAPHGGPLAHWELGGGVLVHSGFTNDIDNDFETDAYERVDLMAARNVGEQLRFQVNVRNLLDQEYIERPGFLESGNQFGTPVSVLGRVTYRF